MVITFDCFRELSFLYVCVFYDGPTPSRDVQILMSHEYQNAELNVRYPGYRYLFLERHKNYRDPAITDIVQTKDIIARCLPSRYDEGDIAIAASAANVDGELTLQSFHAFMDYLVNKNAARCRHLWLPPDFPINEVAERLFPETLSRTEEDICRIFEPVENRNNANLALDTNITIKIEPNPDEEEDAWNVILYADGMAHEIALNGWIRKAILIYFLLHKNERVRRDDFEPKADGRNELCAICKEVTRSLLEDQTINTRITSNCCKAAFSNHLVKMKKGTNKILKNADDFYAKLPLEWIHNLTPPKSGPKPAEWAFLPPENVTVDVRSFSQSLTSQE